MLLCTFPPAAVHLFKTLTLSTSILYNFCYIYIYIYNYKNKICFFIYQKKYRGGAVKIYKNQTQNIFILFGAI